jgi:hypothetical protein
MRKFINILNNFLLVSDINRIKFRNDIKGLRAVAFVSEIFSF